MTRPGLHCGNFVVGSLSDGCGFPLCADRFVLQVESQDGVHTNLHESLVRRSVNQILLTIVHDVQLDSRAAADVKVHMVFCDRWAIGRGGAVDLPNLALGGPQYDSASRPSPHQRARRP